MSEAQQGPEWWQASDGKWYPPQNPQYSPPVPSQGAPPYNPAGQYSPYGYAPTSVNPFESRGTTIMVLGILSLVGCAILGPVAWVMGNGVKRDAEGAGYPEPGNSKAGRICGIVGTCLAVVGIVAWILIAVVFATAATRFPTTVPR